MGCRTSEGGLRALAGRPFATSQLALAERRRYLGGATRTQLILAGIAFGLLALLLATPKDVAAGDLATVSTDVLNVRSGPTADSPVIAQAAWGEVLDVWWGPSEDGLYEVMYGDVHGYVSGSYIVFDGGVGGAATVEGSSGGEEPVAAAATSNRYVDVDRSSGLVTLYEDGIAVYTVWGAMGWEQSDDGFYATANGTFYVFAREEGLTWTDWGRAYVTNYVAFDAKRSNGFHSYSLDKNGQLLEDGGNGPTGGCIAIAPWAIEAVYDFAQVGTRVDVHW